MTCGVRPAGTNAKSFPIAAETIVGARAVSKAVTAVSNSAATPKTTIKVDAHGVAYQTTYGNSCPQRIDRPYYVRWGATAMGTPAGTTTTTITPTVGLSGTLMRSQEAAAVTTRQATTGMGGAVHHPMLHPQTPRSDLYAPTSGPYGPYSSQTTQPDTSGHSPATP